jgi:hypothetical protein
MSIILQVRDLPLGAVLKMRWLLVSIVLTSSACSSGDLHSDDSPPRSAASLRQAVLLEDATELCSEDPRVELNLISLDACVGGELFFRDTFDGNGRSCGSCHPASNNFTIDVPFIASLPNTDPLFIAEQDPALADLERPDLMRDFGLILENVDGLEDPTNKFVMRSVPHCFSLSTSITAQATPTDGTTRPPNERTGWGGDGAPNQGELRDFQTGAIVQHYTKSLDRTLGTDFVQATSAELDAIRVFMGSIGRENELDLTLVTLTDSGASSGRSTFLDPTKRCNACHRNAGANVNAGFNRNFDTGVERLRIAELNTQGIPFDGGFGGGGLLTFNFDANHDSVLDSFGNGTFSTPPLIEAADTGPFFHTNAFETIEQATAFYTTSAFAESAAGGGNAIPLSSTEIANIGRFLRVLNASFNIQLALARVEGALPIIVEHHNQFRPLQQELLALALAEVNDALEVLSAVSSLNTDAQADLSAAQGFLEVASTHASHVHRENNAEDALDALDDANTALGTGLELVIGEGTLMF